MNDLPDNGMPGFKPSSLDSWNIERLWSRPLARLGVQVNPERIPSLADLRKSLSERARKSAERGSLSGRNAAARSGLLDDLARHDLDES